MYIYFKCYRLYMHIYMLYVTYIYIYIYGRYRVLEYGKRKDGRA